MPYVLTVLSTNLRTTLLGNVNWTVSVINQRTKFEVSISAHYEDAKKDTKCGKWGDLA